jgi:uncharacterized MAPEG superfamily protein
MCCLNHELNHALARANSCSRSPYPAALANVTAYVAKGSLSPAQAVEEVIFSFFRLVFVEDGATNDCTLNY